MANLAIDFQDGFHNDVAIIWLDKTEVFHETGVSTSPLLGLATSFSIELSTGSIFVELQIPTRNLSTTLSINIDADTYIGVYIEHNNLEYTISEEPFYYA